MTDLSPDRAKFSLVFLSKSRLSSDERQRHSVVDLLVTRFRRRIDKRGSAKQAFCDSRNFINVLSKKLRKTSANVYTNADISVDEDALEGGG